MKNYIKSLISISGILAGGNYVCGMVSNEQPEPKEGRTIIATFNITVFAVDKYVQIINGKDGDCSVMTGIGSIDIYKLGNNNEYQVEHIGGKDKDGKIYKKYKFSTPGEYRIYYYFKQDVMITDMSYMFCKCYSLFDVDFSHFDSQNVIDMSYMFYQCSSLTDLDVSNFNANSVTNMSYMFYNCSSLTSLDLSNFNTVNVTNMSYMFAKCYYLKDLDLSNFNTQNVKKMYYMFFECCSLTSLDLSNFNTESVTDMSCMFYECSSLTSLNLSHFNTCSVKYKGYFFYGCSSLEEVTTNDIYINECFEFNKKYFESNSQSQSKSNYWCCPCWKNR